MGKSVYEKHFIGDDVGNRVNVRDRNEIDVLCWGRLLCESISK